MAGWSHAQGSLPRADLFALVPQLGLRFEPQFEQLDRLLDDEIVEAVLVAMAGRAPRSRSCGCSW